LGIASEAVTAERLRATHGGECEARRDEAWSP
jgi:hypothetical protein